MEAELLEVMALVVREPDVLVPVEAVFAFSVHGLDRFQEASDQTGVERFPTSLQVGAAMGATLTLWNDFGHDKGAGVFLMVSIGS